MTSARQIRRSRRSATRQNSGSLLALLALALALTAAIGLLLSSAYLAVIRGLPEVGRVEAQFGMRGAERYRPIQVYDSSGEHLLYQYLHPAAQSRQWFDVNSLPDAVVNATVAVIEPEFWSSRGFDLEGNTISERVVEVALMEPGEPTFIRSLQRALLAADLTRRYPKDRVLAWYLNSADYGNAAFGIDAAALVYYGKHADELSIGESASLAALLTATENPEAGRAQVLEAMLDQDLITRSQARAARTDSYPSTEGLDLPPFADYSIQQVRQVLGDAAGRSGLTVQSTIDYDLQQQAACAAETHVARLSGEPIGAVTNTDDDSPCVSAALLPTLRPRDAGYDHGIDEWALVVIDPTSGEILAAQGSFDRLSNPEPLLDPFTYLTAFSRGSTPSSMVVDLGSDPHGPVRMRTALANSYPDAAEATLAALGEDSVNRTLNQLGLSGARDSASLLDLTAAYGVLAAEGRRIGAESAPSIVQKIEDSDGEVLFEYRPDQSAVVSPQLAYLMADALSDESARWDDLGKGNSLEIGRSAGAISGGSDGNWAIGFTPQRTVGVWLGGPSMRDVDRTNGAAAIWNAVTRFASAELPPVTWQIPAGVTELEVCDPSGLLPTQHCPEIVHEVFILGTEPTQYDNLFQPFRINRETGKLATLLTPLQSVEERVYFIPPPIAEEWAIATGVERPPQEYDTLATDPAESPGVRLSAPVPFKVVADNVIVRGDASAEGFEYYRLQYGQGLNPARWIQIESDQDIPVDAGRLGIWDTEGLNGLYTLQLMVVMEDGQVRTAAAPVTIDNEPPSIELLLPAEGDTFSQSSHDEISLSASALDGVELERVDFFVDGERIGSVRSTPYRLDWELPSQTQEVEIFARAYDRAGNRAESQRVVIEITR